MKFSLSTNWCNCRLSSGEEIADEVVRLGFDELELGFNTTQEQVAGIKRRLDKIPVGSVHAFCPVPISAPQGHPELYSLASTDDETRQMAQLMISKNILFAADLGADVLVLHAGRARCHGYLRRFEQRRRIKYGRKMLEIFRRELDRLIPKLEKSKVVLGLENLPYLEGFPAEWEIGDVVGDWVRPWLDTGHDYVREVNGWKNIAVANPLDSANILPVGMHLNDSLGGDDHLAPGEGKVDFASLRSQAEQARHLVLEPNSSVDDESIRRGVEFLKNLWAV